jgi:TPP-dependent pyruvate/acetoin dehydrogenase alpha subunit
MARDPIPRFERDLLDQGILDDERVAQIASEVGQIVDEAEAFAINSPEPPPEAALDLVLAPREVN